MFGYLPKNIPCVSLNSGFLPLFLEKTKVRSLYVSNHIKKKKPPYLQSNFSNEKHITTYIKY